MNLFSIARYAGRGTEPFVTQYLAALLNEEKDLLAAVWKICVGDDAEWPVPIVPVIKAEDRFVDGRRIDLTIRDQHLGRGLGLELKLFEGSVKEGQLTTYAVHLEKHFGHDSYRLVFVTPYTKQHPPGPIRHSPAIDEFSSFVVGYPSARHFSWLDIVNLGVSVADKHWPDFVAFVVDLCEPPPPPSNEGQAPLSSFFSDYDVDEFRAKLRDADIVVTPAGIVDLRAIVNPHGLISALEVLVQSESVATTARKADDLLVGIRSRFLNSTQSQVHEALFELAKEHPWVWVEGTGDYGVRVAYPGRTNGVSIASTHGPERLQINHWRGIS